MTAMTSSGPAAQMICGVLPERMPPIPEARMTEEQKRAAAEIAAGPRGELRGPFHALLRSPELMRRVQKVGEYLRFQGVLEPRIAELAALIAARAMSQQYEWNAHSAHALKAGLAPAVIEAIAEGRRPAPMAADEEIAYDFATELLANKGVADATYERAVGRFGEQGLVDLVAVLGYYKLLAMVMNVARTAIPGGMPLPLAPLPLQLVPRR